jgi:transposase InsO family protein
MALRRHGPPPRGLVHHGDRGARHASEPYRAVLGRHGIARSMRGRGDAPDNAPAEGLSATSESTRL